MFRTSDSYSGFPASMLTMFQAALGNFDFVEIADASGADEARMVYGERRSRATAGGGMHGREGGMLRLVLLLPLRPLPAQLGGVPRLLLQCCNGS